MSNLNSSWVFLTVIGILILFATMGFNFYQSISGNNSEFNASVNIINNRQLLLEKIENHLREASDFGN